jgi:hypothetical protein
MLPVKTIDVALRCVADLLGGLTDYLGVARRGPDELAVEKGLLEAAFDRLDKVSPTTRPPFGRRFHGVRRTG